MKSNETVTPPVSQNPRKIRLFRQGGHRFHFKWNFWRDFLVWKVPFHVEPVEPPTRRRQK